MYPFEVMWYYLEDIFYRGIYHGIIAFIIGQLIGNMMIKTINRIWFIIQLKLSEKGFYKWLDKKIGTL